MSSDIELKPMPFGDSQFNEFETKYKELRDKLFAIPEIPKATTHRNEYLKEISAERMAERLKVIKLLGGADERNI